MLSLTVAQAELASSLQLVSRAVSTRPTHSILANVLLTADAATGRLSLTAFDLNLGIQTSIPAAVTASGATTVPARLFAEIVSRLPCDSPITLAADDEQLQLASLSGCYRIQQQSADDFPDLPLQQNGAPITLQAAELARGLKATLFASSSDESKQLLTGAHLALGAAAEFAATDGHRLAMLRFLRDGATTETAITVPARALRELERLLAASGAEAVEMFTERGQIVFVCGDQVLTSRSLDGDYPNYRQLIPSAFSRTITTDRKCLQYALERVAVLADQHNNVVKISTDPEAGSLLISADVQDVGSGSEKLSAEVSGKAIVIAFNVRYLLDGIKATAAAEITLHANEPTTPVVLRSDDEYTYLVMPVQVRP